MVNNLTAPPSQTELEVSVFGPGYGEAIAVHLGNGSWILVDSCFAPNSKVPATLSYLKGLGVDIQRAVKLIVATHWHDDHVRGLATLLRECKAADLVLPIALRTKEFSGLALLNVTPSLLYGTGLDEFAKIIRLWEERKALRAFKPPKWATADRLLYRENIQLSTAPAEIKIHSLSPSDASILQSQMAFAQLLPQPGEQKKRILSPSPNYVSVALWIEAGSQRVLLGADLENTNNPQTGWSVIINNSITTSGRASVFKVPHHGSSTGHHDAIWSSLLTEQPIAVLTPFVQGRNRLPTDNDVDRIKSLTTQGYITAQPLKRRHRWSSKIVRDFVEATTRNIYNAHSGWGQVRLRSSLNVQGAAWQIDLFGDAKPL